MARNAEAGLKGGARDAGLPQPAGGVRVRDARRAGGPSEGVRGGKARAGVHRTPQQGAAACIIAWGCGGNRRVR
eukprot:1885375-Rhodomonas_salina.1